MLISRENPERISTGFKKFSANCEFPELRVNL